MPNGPSTRSRGRPSSELTDRERAILAKLVREYIDRGEPVSSLWLAEHGGLRLSSATVRNTLAELERRGFVHQPHTSAGRVPTDIGYRWYVDVLLQGRRPTRPSVNVEARLRRAGTVDAVLSDVSHELSRVSQHMGFALSVSNEEVAFRHLDFVKLDETRVMVVVVAAGGQISHKVVDLGENVRDVDLIGAANYVNDLFSGLPLWEVRAAIEAKLQEERTLYDALRAQALRLASASLASLAPQGTLFVQGASMLLDDHSHGEDRISMATLRMLFTLVEEKDRLVRLLDGYIDGPGLTIIIGTEHRAPDLRDLSLVASGYSDGRQHGSVGVIGPRRMRYSRAIAAVDSLSRAVTRVLVSGGDGERTN